MSLLPTAHAGQAFGSRRIDYFTVNGHVSESDSHVGQVVDTDGMDHEVQLMEKTSALAPGDTATVLRVQSGPNRRSRPVALINHSRGVWMRATPDATGVLARSGVTRTLNWWVSLLFLALVAAAAVWTDLHAFLSEVNISLMASVPVFDIYADLAQRMPGLASWRLETALPSGIFDTLAGLGFIPMEQLTEWGTALGAGILALVAFAARSWRLIYLPALAALAILTGGVFSSAEPTLFIVAGTLLLFMIGGFINRIRDGGRFNARVGRLAEHVLRNPPQEGVAAQTSDEAANDRDEKDAVLPAAAAAAAIASAAVVADGDVEDTASDTVDADAADATVDDAPVEAEMSTVTTGETSEAENAVAELNAAMAEDDSAADDTPVAEADAGDQDAEVSAEDTDENTGETAADADAADTVAAHDAADAGEANDADTPAVAADEDDLPTLDDVAAAAALTDSESQDAKEASDAPTAIDLDDERTMPVAPPPPMPAAAEAADSEADAVQADGENGAIEAEARPASELEDAGLDTPADDVQAAIAASDTDPVETAEPSEPTLSEDPAEHPAEDQAEDLAAAPVDDPLIDDAADPMIESGADGDFAPGAPDIELDRSPAE